MAMNGRLYDCKVHAFDLAVGPGMLDLGQPVINVVSGASTLESMAPEQLSFRSHLLDVRRCPALTSWISKLNAVVSENRVDGVGNRCNKIVQELLRDGSCSPLVKFNMGKLDGPVDGHEKMKLAFCGSDFGNVDMEVAYWVSLELLLRSLVAFDLWQPLDAMTLKAAMQ